MVEVGKIGNYYSYLSIKEKDGKYFWGILDWDDERAWDEIPESLYKELIKFTESKGLFSNNAGLPSRHIHNLDHRKSWVSLPITYQNGVPVMHSLDLAKLCSGDALYAHQNFMKRAEKVLGERVVNFYYESTRKQGNSYSYLMLPETEACLMAMSYSHELQGHVYDVWQQSKNRNNKKFRRVSISERSRSCILIVIYFGLLFSYCSTL